MKTAKSKKLHKENCYRELKVRIVTGAYRPGATLDEKDLMAEYAIGRTPLRELLLRFQGDGLIIRVPRGGTVVAPLDISNFMHIMETRTPLELFAAELACRRITDEQIQDLHNQLERMLLILESSDIGNEFARLEIAFHASIYRSTQNPELSHLLEQLHDKSARVWYCLAGINENTSFGSEDLTEVLQALAARNINQMKRITRRHLAGLVAEVEKRINT